MAFKEVSNICTNDYDKNEYLAFLSAILYDICNVMSINEQKQWHEDKAIMPMQSL